MGIAVDSLFSVMMSWVRALVSALWALLSGDRTTALEFLGKNWMTVAAVIIICGLVIDWIVWLIRWQPYHLWARRARKLLRLDEPDEEKTPKKGRAHAAVMPEKRYARPQETPRYEETYGFDEGGELDEDEAALIREEARARAKAEQERLAREAYEAEQERLAHEAYEAEQERLAREAYEAEQERLAREAYEAEQERLAREAYEAEQERLAREAYEAEQARLAQEEYARQMEEYERQMAQYERDLAEYERQKAAYEAQIAQKEQNEILVRRRRIAAMEEETPATAPEQAAARTANPRQQRERQTGVSASKSAKTEKRMEHHQDAKHDVGGKLLGRVAKMIEPEEEEIISRKTLPPRVDMYDAFRTAKLPVVTPPKDSKRRKG